MGQLALPLGLADHAVFDSFHAHGNEEAVALLESIAARAQTGSCWLWGPSATGKTHLLQAVCERAGDRSVFVPMTTLAEMAPDVLDGLETREVICIDDIESVAGNRDWEMGLFKLFNALGAHGGSLVVAATTSPRECPVELADLASRLRQLPAYRLRDLEDAERARALMLRASHRGLELPTDTARYLLHRSRRDMTSLYDLLDTLDREALRAQRRLTIPFVSDVLKTLSRDDSA